MEIYKNKKSQKYFICLGTIPNTNDGRFINPNPQIIRLPLSLFENSVDEDEETLVSKGFITNAQVDLYRRNEEKEDLEPVERILLELEFERWSPEELSIFIEKLKMQSHHKDSKSTAMKLDKMNVLLPSRS